MNKRDVHVYFNEALWKRLEKLAASEDRSMTATVRVLIQEALAARNGK